MTAYTDFAQVYDELMDDTPYEEWCEFLVDILRRYGADDVSKGEECAKYDRCAIGENPEKYVDIDGKTKISLHGASGESEQVDRNLRQERNTVLDLGCGTGTLTELLARRGYDMIGIDNAPEMLQIAMEKRERSGLDILYLLQDMRELELYGTVGAVISVCDSLNYLLEEEDILQTFERVNNYLYPQGLFIFDFNTVYKYAEVIGDATIAENREDCSFIWENYYHEAEEINEYDLTVFVAENRGRAGADAACLNAEGLDEEDAYSMDEALTVCEQTEGQRFRRFQEVHYQRGYRLEQMEALLSQAGLSFLEAFDADTHGAVTEVSERIYVIARKGTETTANQAVVSDKEI